jgi:hypothetical protein
MEIIKNVTDITYLSELILDILVKNYRLKMSRINSQTALRPTTYVAKAP